MSGDTVMCGGYSYAQACFGKRPINGWHMLWAAMWFMGCTYMACGSENLNLIR